MKKRNTIFYYLFVFFIISLFSLNSADKINVNVSNIMIKQVIWYFIGFLVMYLVSKINLDYIYKNKWILYFIINFLLLILLFFGPVINNARCWFRLPGIGTIQISEFVKVIIIIVLSAFFYNSRKRKDIYVVVFSIIIILVPALLTFLEPDTGAVIMYLVILLSMHMFRGINKKWYIFSFSIISLFLISFVSIYLVNKSLFFNIFGSSSFLRVERITNWINKEGLQLNRSLISIGISGITGTGINNNQIYFPEAHTDFIFTVFSSNFGFLGSCILIINIILFNFHLINIGLKVKNKKYKYFIVGVVSLLFYQQVQNISMTIGLLPITGITLPFISYGGSSLLSYFIMLGLILNIEKKHLRRF